MGIEFFSTYGPETTSVGVPAWLDLTAVVVGSLSGIIVARERKLDLVGFIGLSLLCGLGGGLIRDIMMQKGGVYMLSSPYAIPACVIAAVVLFLFPRPLDLFPNLLEWVDIVSVGLFAVIGTDKALVYYLLPVSALLMGTITGIGGGMLRDVFLGDVPRIFQHSNLYATCALAGSLAYWLGTYVFFLLKPWAALVAVVVTVALRRWSLRYDVMIPVDVDLTPQVTRPVRKVVRSARRLRATRRH